MRAAITLLSLGTGLLACTPAPAIEDYPAELEEAYCQWQHGCHQYESVRDCIDDNAIERDPGYMYLLAAQAAGHVEYDREQAARCLDAMQGRSCEYEEEAFSACDNVFRGRIGRNGPCMSTAECAGNAVCGFDPTCTDMCCVGACRVFADPLAVGEPCSSSAGCVPEAYCAFDPSTGAPTVCTALVEAGGDCSFGQGCVEEAICDGERCRKFELRGPGEDCLGDFVDCAPPGECLSSAEGRWRCVAPPQLGAPCDDRISCARFDTFCDPNSQLCTLLPGPGQGCGASDCVPYAQCQSEVEGAVDSEIAYTCVAKAGEGEPCGSRDDQYVECRPPFQCVDGETCTLPEVESGPACPVPDAG
ncbi:MAG TPA: hypothetical protein VGB85_23745 [Nannocystis sp.]